MSTENFRNLKHFIKPVFIYVFDELFLLYCALFLLRISFHATSCKKVLRHFDFRTYNRIVLERESVG